MRSGVNVDVEAEVMLDNPSHSSDIFFYDDEACSHLLAVVKRDQVAGLILYPRKSGVVTATTPLAGQR